jgi:hypothetical protein
MNMTNGNYTFMIAGSENDQINTRQLIGSAEDRARKHSLRNRSLEPTPFVKRFGSHLAHAAGKSPIIDVACGSGRHALFLAQLGCTVICVDKDLSRLPDEAKLSKLPLTRCQLDLITDPWPFGAATIGGIILVDFLHLPLISRFEESLISGGLLLLETVSGRGENYRELPQAGEVLVAAQSAFDIKFYKESLVGPPQLRRVSVKMLARRLQRPSEL